jgi:NADH-dependent peroxiredoxin subunit F
MAKLDHYDLIILGAGPAGMTAGVYAARKQLSTLILTGDIGGQANWSSGIENYLGYVFITGAELVAKFEEHLKQFDIEVEFSKAAKLERSNDGFSVVTEAGQTVVSKAVVVATGKSPKMLDVEGERDFIGRGVTYCATCDGPMYSGMSVAVVGGGNSGLDAAIQLMKICPKVYVVESKTALTADEVVVQQVEAAENVEVLKHTSIRKISGEQFVTSITLEDLDTNRRYDVPVQGVFIEIGLSPNSGIVKDLLPFNERGEILVDCAARTEVPGLFAAGDVTAIPEKQIIIAAGDGAKAALGAYSYIVRLPRAAVSDWAKPVY